MERGWNIMTPTTGTLVCMLGAGLKLTKPCQLVRVTLGRRMKLAILLDLIIL